MRIVEKSGLPDISSKAGARERVNFGVDPNPTDRPLSVNLPTGFDHLSEAMTDDVRRRAQFVWNVSFVFQFLLQREFPAAVSCRA